MCPIVGRSPKPTAIHILNGNPSKKKLNDTEPQPDPLETTPPPELDAIAATEWQRLAPELARLGLLSKLDRAALMAYCATYSRWCRAEELVRKNGMCVATARGGMQIAPWVRIAQSSLHEMLAYLREFGLTPSSRTRLSVPESPDEDAAFFG